MSVLVVLYALRDLYQAKHWESRTYSDHLRYERLYTDVNADIDPSAELIRGRLGNLAESAALRLATASKEIENARGNPIALEGRLAEAISNVKALRPSDSGWTNHWDSLLTKSATRLYVLSFA